LSSLQLAIQQFADSSPRLPTKILRDDFLTIKFPKAVLTVGAALPAYGVDIAFSVFHPRKQPRTRTMSELSEVNSQAGAGSIPERPLQQFTE
jgi:hypothetical protein